MANENCEILFEYLRSILYDSSPTQIDIHSLDPDFQKLGLGTAVFRSCDSRNETMFNGSCER